jgi:outer membrane protein TolC
MTMTMTMTKRPALTLLAAAAAVALAACSSAPVSAPPVAAAPAAWSLANGTIAPDWAGQLDPQLAALQAQALRANLDIALAAQRWTQARLLAEQAELRWQPSASANANASRPLQQQSSSRNVDIGGVSVPVTSSVGWTRSYGASLGVGYELDLWGRLAQTQSVQRAQAEAARTDIDAARLLLRSRVAEAYWTLAAIAEQRPRAQTQVALANEILTLTRRRVAEGKLLPIETDKAAGLLQAAESKLADLDADAQLQRGTLAVLLDQPPPALTDPRLPGGDPPVWQLASPAEVLAQRPDVQRARLSVDASLARLRAAEADRYPRLSFSVNASTGGSRVADWLSQPLASLAANLTVPLIDWKRLDLQRDGQRSELEQSALSLRDTVNKAVNDIDAQRIDAARLQQQLAANAQRLREATEAERLAALKYDVGTIARLDWLQSQNARLDAEQGRIQLRLRQWLNQSALFKALGGAG